MAWTTLRWKSETIGKATSAEVLLPEVGAPPYPVFYLLHGLSDDATTWLRHTRLEYYARQRPMMIVMPDGYRSFYTKAEFLDLVQNAPSMEEQIRKLYFTG